uniref:Uncharacterized protein n=1 Tax=Tetranychus urticae TaxID=32264 RepID=T1JQW7_TETUR
MGCTPSSRRSRTETELKYSCPNETANEDTNNQTEPLNCSQKSSESKPFLPMTYYDNNKDLSNCKDLSNKNKDNTLKLGSMCLSMPQLKVQNESSRMRNENQGDNFQVNKDNSNFLLIINDNNDTEKMFNRLNNFFNIFPFNSMIKLTVSRFVCSLASNMISFELCRLSGPDDDDL